MNGITKTALFLSGLEWSTADTLLGRLAPEESKAVRQEMLSLNSVSVRDSERVAQEFLSRASLNKAGKKTVRKNDYRERYTRSDDYGLQIRHNSNTNRISQSALQEYSQEYVSKPFDFLRKLPPEDIANEILQELPQTVAVVLAHLPASKAGEVLAVLPNPLQLDAARCLTNYQPMDEQILRDMEAALKERFRTRQGNEQRKVQELAVMNTILKSALRRVDS
jgi:flagellar motor switch protein FliG